MQRLENKDCEDLLNFRSAIIAENVKRARRNSGLNIETVAFLCNTSSAVIVYAERGTNRYHKAYTPDIHTLDKMAKIFGVSITDLITKKNG